MKKVIVASILGMALNVASSYGQGYIVVQNYDYVFGTTPAYSGVSYGAGNGGLSGEFVGGQFSADLLYSSTGTAGSFSLVPGTLTAFYTGATDGGTPTSNGAGVFLGNTATIAGYTAGSTAYFEVQAFTGSSYGTPGDYAGTSAVFSIANLQTSNLLPPGDLLNLGGSQTPPPSSTTVEGLQPFTVSLIPVPEPSIFALSSIGAAALMLIRRKKVS